MEAPLDPGEATLGGRPGACREVEVRRQSPPVLPSAPPPPPFCPHLTVGDGARPGDPGGVGGVGRALVPPRRPWDSRSAAPPFWARVSARKGGLVRLCPGDDVRVKRGLLFGKPLEK